MGIEEPVLDILQDIAADMPRTKIFRYSQTANQYGGIILQSLDVRNVCFDFLLPRVRQVRYPYTRICQRKSTDNSLIVTIQLVAISLAQQLFG